MEMIAKIRCDRCGYEENIPAQKIIGRIYREPPLPKEWGLMYKSSEVYSFRGTPILLCPKCLKEAKEMEQKFILDKKVKKPKQ